MEVSDQQTVSEKTKALREIRAAFANIPRVDSFEAAMTCMACPCQIEGKVDGMFFYFRSRHGYWQCGFHPTDPVGTTMGNAPGATADDGYLVEGEHTADDEDILSCWMLMMQSVCKYATWRSEEKRKCLSGSLT